MSVAKQLYQLQEVELELESNGQALKQITSQLGESQAVVKAQAKLSSESQRLEELTTAWLSPSWLVICLTVTIYPAQEAQMRLQISARMPLEVKEIILNKAGEPVSMVCSSQRRR